MMERHWRLNALCHYGDAYRETDAISGQKEERGAECRMNIVNTMQVSRL